jgi:4'-phosphopantetheinyl transferase
MSRGIDGATMLLNVPMKGSVNWQIPPRQLTLHQGDVHVWYTSLQKGGRDYSNCFGILSHQERTRASRYRFNLDREQFVARRGILRIILRKYFGNLPGGFEINSDNFGKPEISSKSEVSNISISLSHSQNSIVYALSNNSRVGIDIEYIKQLEFKPILRTILPAHKIEKVDSLNDLEAGFLFYNIWTIVEAYLKAVGVGFRQPLDEVFWANFPFDVAYENKIIDPHWSIFQFIPQEGFFSTLMVNSPEIQTSFFMFNG